jgi:hypothetical protein
LAALGAIDVGELMKLAATIICIQLIASITIAAVRPVATASVRGYVRDELGKPIEKAQVRIYSGDALLKEAYTDASGKYEIRQLPKGKLTVTAWSLGFATKKSRLKLRGGQEKEINFVLVAGTTWQQ